MACTQSLLQIRNNVRKLADVEGTTALVRHPDADINDYINRGIGAFHRILTQAAPDERVLASSTISTTSGTSVYALPSDFDHLVSFDLTANGAKVWLVAYELNERPLLTNTTISFSGIPFTYRLRGSNVELLPTPASTYTGTLWYVTAPTQLSGDGSAWDTINRLDDYLIAYAAKLVATKDKSWDLVGECRTTLGELDTEIRILARSRDKNSPPRVVDEMLTNRFGRRVGLPRRWR